MRVLALAVGMLGCAEEKEEESEPIECPDLSATPVDVDSGNPSLDEFFETAPEVDAEVARIDGVVRGGCAAIASDLGGDPSGLDTLGACDLAANLVEGVAAANPEAWFECSLDPFAASWNGTATAPEDVDALVATLSAHLGEVMSAAEAAQVQEEISRATAELVESPTVEIDAEMVACLPEVMEIYVHAITVCGEYVEASARFLSALSGCGVNP